ncbi:MAG: biopolymer transporter ExbD [Bacteroidetes bacterium]|nr:MAG: biopolymer transporter ExbD [Bacteroidota bacterium]
MAKREIPEINAGSMADIAFLLLIFFLVTTTMDKDQAYIRSIPKKIEVKNDPVEVQKRDILAIKANSQNQLMVRGEVFNDPDKISDFVLKFYQTNQKSAGQLVMNDFPLYSVITTSQIEANIDKILDEIDAMEAAGSPQDQIDFKYNQLAEWEKKQRALKLYGGSQLPEISFQANMRIEVMQATAYSIFAKIQTEIEEAIYELRDKEAQRLWGVSYGTLKRKEANENDKTKVKEEKGKLELLEILYPARIIEVTPKN